MPRKPKEPCLATTHAYNTIIPCGRPVGHSNKIPTGERQNFAWSGGHNEDPFKKDGPVYGYYSYKAFAVDTRTVRNG